MSRRACVLRNSKWVGSNFIKSCSLKRTPNATETASPSAADKTNDSLPEMKILGVDLFAIAKPSQKNVLNRHGSYL
jgi:hypothetical protein